MAAESTSFVPNKWITMPSDLWSFTLDFYARPGIEQACLDLQARGGNVCLLLLGIWLDKRGVVWEASRTQQIVELAGPWDEAVVQPLRQLRTNWRAAASSDATLGGMRDEIKALELKAEHELLTRLEMLAQDWPVQITRGEHQWLTALAGEAGGLSRDALNKLRVAADQA
jgi:uncharacterized protein (TIGR02444 family)